MSEHLRHRRSANGGGGRSPAIMDRLDDGEGALAQIGGQRMRHPLPALDEEHVCLAHLQSEHLFEAKGLRARLEEGMRLVGATPDLVLDRNRLAVRRIGRQQLDHVRFAHQPVPLRPNRQPAQHPPPPLHPVLILVHPPVRPGAPEGEEVLVPDGFEVDQSALPGAVGPVLDSAYGDEVGFRYPIRIVRSARRLPEDSPFEVPPGTARSIEGSEHPRVDGC